MIHFFSDIITPTDKTIKLWKVSERDKRPEGYNLKDEEGRIKDISTVTSLRVFPQLGYWVNQMIG